MKETLILLAFFKKSLSSWQVVLPKPKIQVSDFQYDPSSPLRYTTTLLGLNYNRAPDNCFYSHFFLEPCVSLLCCHKSCNSSLSLSVSEYILLLYYSPRIDDSFTWCTSGNTVHFEDSLR